MVKLISYLHKKIKRYLLSRRVEAILSKSGFILHLRETMKCLTMIKIFNDFIFFICHQTN